MELICPVKSTEESSSYLALETPFGAIPDMDEAAINQFLKAVQIRKLDPTAAVIRCPYSGTACSKPEPICSISKAGSQDNLVSVCPKRLTMTPEVVTRLLQSCNLQKDGAQGILLPEFELNSAIGRLDFVLANEKTKAWAAIEVQTVYCSGSSIKEGLNKPRTAQGLAVDAGRPDFKSSGPKRLIPQLLSKVPALEPGKRPLIVVVDAWWYRQAPRLKALIDKRVEQNVSYEKSEHGVIWAVLEANRCAHATLKYLAPTSLQESLDALIDFAPIDEATTSAKVAARIYQEMGRLSQQALF